MKTTKLSPLKAANVAAKSSFDAHLAHARATATMYVPECVIDAAKAAYAAAGGRGDIVVAGYGNHTHPVCGVEVRKARS